MTLQLDFPKTPMLVKIRLNKVCFQHSNLGKSGKARLIFPRVDNHELSRDFRTTVKDYGIGLKSKPSEMKRTQEQSPDNTSGLFGRWGDFA